MSPKKVFLYGEFQMSVPSFTQELWGSVNSQLKEVKGLLTKTWLHGIGANTVGGFYEFDFNYDMNLEVKAMSVILF